jgi:CBS domain-containing protein
MQVSEVMTRDITIASPEDSLREAAAMMADIDAGALPVGEDDRLVGMLTDRDITVRAVAEGRVPDECRVGEIMSPEIRYIYEDESLEDAARNMAELQVRRLPVLSREKRLVGVLSLGDLAVRQKRAAGDALEGVSQH